MMRPGAATIEIEPVHLFNLKDYRLLFTARQQAFFGDSAPGGGHLLFARAAAANRRAWCGAGRTGIRAGCSYSICMCRSASGGAASGGSCWKRCAPPRRRRDSARCMCGFAAGTVRKTRCGIFWKGSPGRVFGWRRRSGWSCLPERNANCGCVPVPGGGGCCRWKRRWMRWGRRSARRWRSGSGVSVKGWSGFR